MDTKTDQVSFSGWRRLTASRLLSWVVLLAGLLFTLWVWRLVDKSTRELGQARFDLQAESIRAHILEHMDNNEQLLRGCVGLFNALPEVTRQTWRAYIESLQLERNYPGVEGVGFAKRVRPAELAEHLQQMHAEGFTNYFLRPEGARLEYFPVVYLEPFAGRNLRAFGFDTYSESTRHVAMERARDTGQAALTSKVILVQESQTEPVQNGFLLYFPVYAKGRLLRTPEERRAALLGFAYSPFRAGDFLRATLFPAQSEVQVDVFDGPEPKPERRLFGLSTPDAALARFTRTLQIQFYGQTWTVVVAALPALETTLVSYRPQLTLTGGLVLSWLVFGLTWAQASRQRAEMALRRAKEELEQRVLERTAQLAQTNERLQQTRDALARANAELERRVQERSSSLEETTRLLNDFCYSIAHDLKAPIRAQVSFAQVLLAKSGRQLGAEGRHYAERIVEAAMRQGQLVSDLLAHMSLGRAELPLEPVPLAKALASAQTDLRLEIEQRQACLLLVGTSVPSPEGPSSPDSVALSPSDGERAGVRGASSLELPVLANPASLHLVLLNLLSNALKFVPRDRKPEIRVWAEEVRRPEGGAQGTALNPQPSTPNSSALPPCAEGRTGVKGGDAPTLHAPRSTLHTFVRLWVEDNGIGIPSEQRQKLFGVFQRLHPREPYPGTGIGLAIVKRAVERMGGSVGVESSEGQGSRFWVELRKAES